MIFRLAPAASSPAAPPSFQWLAVSLAAHVGLAALILASVSFTLPVVPAADVVGVEIVTLVADPPIEEALPAAAPSETRVEDVPVPEPSATPREVPREVVMADVPPPVPPAAPQEDLPPEVLPSEAPAPQRPAPLPKVKPRAMPRPAPVPAPAAVAVEDRVRPARDASQSVPPSPDERSAGASAPASVPESPPDDRLNDYNARVWKSINRYKPRKIRWAGAAEVTFRVSAEGAVVDVRISASSGNEGLDAAALEAVIRAAPLPAPPHGGMTLAILFHFQ